MSRSCDQGQGHTNVTKYIHSRMVRLRLTGNLFFMFSYYRILWQNYIIQNVNHNPWLWIRKWVIGFRDMHRATSCWRHAGNSRQWAPLYRRTNTALCGGIVIFTAARLSFATAETNTFIAW